MLIYKPFLNEYMSFQVTESLKQSGLSIALTHLCKVQLR